MSCSFCVKVQEGGANDSSITKKLNTKSNAIFVYDKL